MSRAAEQRGPERRRVLIIHPWLPKYRVRFFERLHAELAERGIDLTVAVGAPPPEVRARNDNARSDLVIQLDTRFATGSVRRQFSRKSLKPLRPLSQYDLVVLEDALRNAETYLLLAAARRNGYKVAFWGHGKTLTKKHTGPEQRLKQRLIKRGHWFFGYTPGAVEAAVEAGVSRANTTVVMNSIDTDELQRDLAAVTDDMIAALDSRYDLRGHTALALGAIDATKRVDFLVEAADLVHADDPDFRLLIAGDGDLRADLEAQAADRPWMHVVGRTDGVEKAALLRASQIIMNPGRVGLVAVDSLHAQCPIVTVEADYHAPEFEYLTNGHNSVVSRDTITAYVADTMSLLGSTDALSRLREGCRSEAGLVSMTTMIDNFAEGTAEAMRFSPVSSRTA